MWEVVIVLMLIVFAFVTGYTVQNKQSLKAEQRCYELAKSCKDLEDKIKQRDKLINNHIKSLAKKDECLLDIINKAKENNYGNEKAIIGKMSELAETGIQY